MTLAGGKVLKSFARLTGDMLAGDFRLPRGGCGCGMAADKGSRA